MLSYCSQCFVTVYMFSETLTGIYPIYWYWADRLYFYNEIIFCFGFLLFSILAHLIILWLIYQIHKWYVFFSGILFLKIFFKISKSISTY